MPLFVQNVTEMENEDVDSPIPSNTPSTGPVSSKNPVVTCGNKVLEIIQRHQRDARQRMEGLDQDFKSKLEKMREASREKVHNPNYKPSSSFKKPNTPAYLPTLLATRNSSINDYNDGRNSFENTSPEPNIEAQDSFNHILHAESDEYLSPPAINLNNQVQGNKTVPLAPTPAYGNLNGNGVSILGKNSSDTQDSRRNSVRFSDQMRNLSVTANFAETNNDQIIYEPEECFCDNDMFPPNNNHSGSFPNNPNSNSSSRRYSDRDKPQARANVTSTTTRQSADNSHENSLNGQLRARRGSEPTRFNNLTHQRATDRRHVNVKDSDLSLRGNDSSTFIISPPTNSQNSSTTRIRTLESTRSSAMGTGAEQEACNQIRDNVSHRDSEEYLNDIWYYFWGVVAIIAIAALIYGLWVTISYFRESLGSMEFDEEDPYSDKPVSGKTLAKKSSNNYVMPLVVI